MESNQAENFFFETFFMYFEDTRKYRYRLKNHPFSIIEARLLEAHSLYRKNQWKKVLSLLNSFTANTLVLEGVRIFILGMTYNQLGAYHKGEPLLESALSILDKVHFRRMPFYVCSVIVINLANLRKKNKIKPYFDKLLTYPISSTDDLIQKYQAQLAYFIVLEKADEGIALIESVMQEYNNEIGGHIPFYLTMYFMFSFQKKDYAKCFEIMERYKKYKGCKVKVNYAFQKNMLEHIVEDKPLYIYPKDFGEDPTLFKQALVAKHLSVGEVKQAQEYWDKLQSEFPHLYENGFQYRGEWGLFAAAVAKHVHKSESAQILDLEELKNIKKIEDKIWYILETSSRPISKEDLIHFVWGELVDEKNSDRLYKQMSRIRKKFPGKIATAQGMYWLEKEQKKGA